MDGLLRQAGTAIDSGGATGVGSGEQKTVSHPPAGGRTAAFNPVPVSLIILLSESRITKQLHLHGGPAKVCRRCRSSA